jgi:hypothetical protein
MCGSSIKEMLYNFSLLLSARAVQFLKGFFFAVGRMPAPKEFFVTFWYRVVAVIFPIEISARKLCVVTPSLKDVITNCLDFFDCLCVVSFRHSISFLEPRRCGNNQSLLGWLL